jgi:hypothetical protein
LVENLRIYEVTLIELFIHMKNLQKIIKVNRKTMLEKFNSFECLSLNIPKGWKCWFGAIKYIKFGIFSPYAK